MQCFNHPDMEAIGTCVNCGKAVCESCAVDVEGRLFCQQCLASGMTGNTDTPSTLSTNPLATVSLVLAVLGIAGCCCSPVIAMVFGVPAAITGYIARNRGDGYGSGQGAQLATIGLALGVAETLVGLIVLIFAGSTIGLAMLSDLLQNLGR